MASYTRMEMALRYGCNPHQTPARLLMPEDAAPLSMLNGRPGYVNMLDALGAWQLVHDKDVVLAATANAASPCRTPRTSCHRSAAHP